MDTIIKKIDKYSQVIISDVSSEYRNPILKLCYKQSKRVFMTPKISDLIIRGADNIHLFDTPLLLSNSKGLRLDERFAKRIVDILGSFVGILVLSPLFLLIALAIKL